MEEMENSPSLSLCSSGVWKEIWETKPLASTQTLSWNAVTMATVRASQSPSLHGGGTSTQISKLSPREAPFPGQPKGQTKSQAGPGLLPLRTSRAQPCPSIALYILTVNWDNTQAGAGDGPEPGSK